MSAFESSQVLNGEWLAAISHTDRFCGGRWILAGVESDERLAICSAIGSAGVSKG